ncbi:MAG: TauD/TfdA family dioxygenase [Phormidesmis sp.]
MPISDSQQFTFQRRRPQRRSLSLVSSDLVKLSPLLPDSRLPLLAQPTLDGLDLVTWAERHRPLIEAQLQQHGGILFRNFRLPSIERFEQLIGAVSGKLQDYDYRSTPRNPVSGKIYTSTEYPSSQTIPLHNEMSYTSCWPGKIWFFCVKAADQGGDTPIADSRRVFDRLSPTLKQQFIRKRVMYVRNYNDDIDLPWQTVFQTGDRQAVERYCHKAGIDFEWKSANHLRTRQVCQAVMAHPHTGDLVWFNQAHLFHISNLPTAVSDHLLAEFQPEDLPRNAYYGDGSPIEATALEEIRAVYHQETIRFPWQSGDILMLDNLLSAHGRMPFSGTRQVVVGMAEPLSGTGL